VCLRSRTRADVKRESHHDSQQMRADTQWPNSCIFTAIAKEPHGVDTLKKDDDYLRFYHQQLPRPKIAGEIHMNPSLCMISKMRPVASHIVVAFPVRHLEGHIVLDFW
jgi:hypothetical protein